jgi:hypothetical protein
MEIQAALARGASKGPVQLLCANRASGMRFALVLATGLSSFCLLAAADDKPTADEQKAITAAKLLKAKTSIDDTLHVDARVTVKFDFANDALLATLAKYPQIGSIQSFDGTKCTAKGYALLQGMPHLRRLTLNKSGVTDKTLVAIAGCKQLRELVIPESTLTDAGLAELTKLTRLETLDISDAVKVTDKGMAVIKQLERLEDLRLNKTSITDKGLMELQPLEGLRALSVGGTRISTEAAEKFVEEMPNLRVIRR